VKRKNSGAGNAMGLALSRGELLGGGGEGCLKAQLSFDAVPAEISLSSRFAHRLPYGFRVNVQLNKEYTLQAGNTMISFMSQIFSMVGITLKSFYCLA